MRFKKRAKQKKTARTQKKQKQKNREKETKKPVEEGRSVWQFLLQTVSGAQRAFSSLPPFSSRFPILFLLHTCDQQRL
jgi:hypothetical protein